MGCGNSGNSKSPELKSGRKIHRVYEEEKKTEDPIPV